MDKYLALLLPFFIKAAQEILDSVLNGKDLKEHQVMALQSAYFELGTWGRHLAADTANTYDNEAVEAVMNLIKDLLAEGGFEIPVV